MTPRASRTIAAAAAELSSKDMCGVINLLWIKKSMHKKDVNMNFGVAQQRAALDGRNEN